MYTKEIDSKIELMGMEFILILMELNILAIEKMINNMEKGLRLDQMGLSMLELI